ncbi:protein of unknown function DUF362 [Ferroglobus placidus DSM 10642]|uniref:DUF362 domain-containing protein n=1 Tax=Ferroglobus placidus (strain DSM 10642 / AEDII12DO) TaxID=589924 RepID=D3RZ95_FERPA|nr:DUF362 domain-containing protein [Ferroglobus placidus]ADC65808.1 protein of unknown function DUF362 [Ferroglobus placidus DSM 10642]
MLIVERVESYDDAWDFVERALKKSGIKNEKAVIKPNFVKFDDPSKGSITHPEVVKAAASFFDEPIIVEGGVTNDAADKCYDEFGLREWKCVNVNRESKVKIRIGGKALKEVEVGKSALLTKELPYISLPKMKVHSLAKITVGIKNNMGFLKKPAIYMHFNIHQKLLDLLSFFKPDFVIVDGVIGGEGSELNTKPVNHGVMIASEDVALVDYLAAYLMGFDPEEIDYVRIAAKGKKVDLEKYEDLRREYRISFLGRLMGALRI